VLLCRAWRALAAAAAATVTVVGAGAALSPGAAQSATQGQRIAAALRVSPLYVDPALSGAFPAPARAALLSEISKAPVPVFVLAVPLPPGGEWANGDQLAAVVHAYLGRAGIYLTIDAQLSTEIDAYTWPSDPYGTGAGPYYAADAALAANLAPATRGAALEQKFLTCVGLIADGQAVPAYQAALRQFDVPPVAPGGGINPLVVVLLVLIVIAALIAAVGGGMWLLRQRQDQLPAWLAAWLGDHPPPAWLRPALAAAARAEPGRRLLALVRGTSQHADPGDDPRAP
jgi:hypothetical protein